MKSKRNLAFSLLVVLALLVMSAVPAFADSPRLHLEISSDGMEAHLVHTMDVRVTRYFVDDCNGQITETVLDPPLDEFSWVVNPSSGQAPIGYITTEVSYLTGGGWSVPEWVDATRNCTESSEGSVCWVGTTTYVTPKHGRYIWAIQVDFTDGTSDEVFYGTAGGPYDKEVTVWDKPIAAARANFSLYVPEEKTWYQTPFLEGQPCNAAQATMKPYGELGMQGFINPDTPGDVCLVEYWGDIPASVNSEYAQHTCDTYWPGGPRPGWHEKMVALKGATGRVYKNGTQWGYWEGDKAAARYRAPLFAPGDQRSLAKTACSAFHYCP